MQQQLLELPWRDTCTAAAAVRTWQHRMSTACLLIKAAGLLSLLWQCADTSLSCIRIAS